MDDELLNIFMGGMTCIGDINRSNYQAQTDEQLAARMKDLMDDDEDFRESVIYFGELYENKLHREQIIDMILLYENQDKLGIPATNSIN
jgi:hypothetical protein